MRVFSLDHVAPPLSQAIIAQLVQRIPMTSETWLTPAMPLLVVPTPPWIPTVRISAPGITSHPFLARPPAPPPPSVPELFDIRSIHCDGGLAGAGMAPAAVLVAERAWDGLYWN